MYGSCGSLSFNADKFLNKVASTTHYVSPERLPPTEDAAELHSYRTYHKVQEWCGNNLPPTEWGWFSDAGGLRPITMTKKQLLNGC